MDLSILIVSWNTRHLLAQCLSSIADVSGVGRLSRTLTLPNSDPVKMDVIVVDNASTDGSAEMVRSQYPWVNLICNAENVGFARANNQALRQSQGRYVILLNSDTQVHAGALERMITCLDQRPQAAACGPRLFNTDGTLQISCYPLLTPEREFWRLIFLDKLWQRATYPQKDWDVKQPRQVEVIKGACLALRREALDQIGLLDERYFMYTEEMDLCYRLLQAGWELWWVPQARVTHHGEASSRQVAADMYIQLYRSKVQFHRKFGGDQRADHFKRLVRLAYLPRIGLSALGAPLSSRTAQYARVCRRLLYELQEM